jgi:flagellar biosynthesis/type III secretory pathway protein FliH
MTIREAYEQAKIEAQKQGVAEGQQEMVAALAVKDNMADTLENLKALQAIMNEIAAKRFA